MSLNSQKGQHIDWKRQNCVFLSVSGRKINSNLWNSHFKKRRVSVCWCSSFAEAVFNYYSKPFGERITQRIRSISQNPMWNPTCQLFFLVFLFCTPVVIKLLQFLRNPLQQSRNFQILSVTAPLLSDCCTTLWLQWLHTRISDTHLLQLE